MDKKLIEQAKSAKSVEELLSLAKDAGVAMDEENAKQLFAQLNRQGELADEELDSVAGGGCNNKSDGLGYLGRRFTATDVATGGPMKCKKCGCNIFVVAEESYIPVALGTEYLVKGACEQCGESAIRTVNVSRDNVKFV